MTSTSRHAPNMRELFVWKTAVKFGIESPHKS